jgi:hypothetical protein
MKNKGKKLSREAILEEEKQMLRITLECVVNENEELKRKNDDMRNTVKANKDQLKEYVENITNKDKVVEKMNNTIERHTQ